MGREVSIKTMKYENIPKKSTVLVVGKDNERRNALCNTILHGVCSEGESQSSLSPFVFYDNGNFKLLAVRELDSHLLNRKVQYIVLMDDFGDKDAKYQIWEKSGCNKPISKFNTFLTIYNNCASGNDVLWINCDQNISSVNEKVYWSSFSVVKDMSKKDKTGSTIVLNVPQKISHMDEKDDDEEENNLETEVKKTSEDDSNCIIL